jgi:phage-related holin
LEEEYHGPYFFGELKEHISCVLLAGVIDCVSNTVLEAIQEEFELPTKIPA